MLGSYAQTMFSQARGLFQNLIGMLGRPALPYFFFFEVKVSKPYRYARK